MRVLDRFFGLPALILFTAGLSVQQAGAAALSIFQTLQDQENIENVFVSENAASIRFRDELNDYLHGPDSQHVHSSVISSNSRVMVLVGPVSIPGEENLGVRVTVAYRLTSNQNKFVNATGRRKKGTAAYYLDPSMAALDSNLEQAITNSAEASGSSLISKAPANGFPSSPSGYGVPYDLNLIMMPPYGFRYGLIRTQEDKLFRTASLYLNSDQLSEIEEKSFLNFVGYLTESSRMIHGHILDYLDRPRVLPGSIKEYDPELIGCVDSLSN